MSPPPISKLAPELLLRVFERLAQDPDSSVTSSVICCKKWQPLAQSVLYRDIFLSGERLIKFAEKNGLADNEIRSLTIRLGPVSVNQFDPNQAVKTTDGWLDALQRLLPRISCMCNIEAFSVWADLPLPYSPCNEFSSIIDELPTTCVALEIDLRHSTFVQQKLGTATTPLVHMCDSVRDVLGRLRHLRLRLPKVCSAVFGIEPEKGTGGYQPVDAPKLKDCIINLTQRMPGTFPRASLATSCDSLHFPHIGSQTWITPVLHSLIPKLQNFAQLNSALERLWVIDCQAPGQGKNSWAAWVRRDIGSDASWPIPVVNIGGFREDAWLARVPSLNSERSTEDEVSWPETLEALVEGCTWSETRTRVRLPVRIFEARGYNYAVRPRTRAQLGDGDDLSCTLWENEEVTGERLLPIGPGPLMETWDLNERTPNGWKRANFTGSIMVQHNR